MQAPELSIVVPVHNEAGNLAPLTEELVSVLARLGRPYEIVYVDDGSTDGSGVELRALARSEPSVRLLRRPSNGGQSAALAAGFRAARGSVVVTLDADLQNDPADIPWLLRALEGADVVSGVRIQRRDGWRRRVASVIANRVRRLVVRDGVTDVGCSLKAFRAELLAGVPPFDGMHRFLPALLELRGARVVEIPVAHRPRVRGRSHYGINDRLWRGIADLVGVRWLARRLVDVGPTREIVAWTSRHSGERSALADRRSSSRGFSSSGSRPSARRGA